MKILLISFYYPPDLSAGSFRAKALIDSLRDRGPNDLQIEVITTSPNRYSSLIGDAHEDEAYGNIRIKRLNIPPHQSGMFDQTKSFMSFARQVLRETRGKKWDIVIGTSSRLMTATLSAAIAHRSSAKLYLDIRDLFTDTMGDLLVNSPMKMLLPAFRLIERIVFRRAARINVVSGGFLPHIKKVAPLHECRVFTNGIDDEFLIERPTRISNRDAQSKVVLYAGNMGDGQGLHNIIPVSASILGADAHFRLIGDGGKRKQLEVGLLLQDTTNVQILNPVPRELLCGYYDAADILFLHLNDQRAFEKVLPSKLFEYAATGKPILAGVAGYAAEFIKNEIPGAEVFAPCDAAGLVQGFHRLSKGQEHFDRTVFCKKYSRRAIMNQMADDILSVPRKN